MNRLRHLPLFVGLALIGTAVGYASLRAAVEVDVAGIPFRANLHSVSCPKCQHFNQRHGNPSYYGSCEHCGLRYATWLDDNRRVVVEPTDK